MLDNTLWLKSVRKSADFYPKKSAPPIFMSHLPIFCKKSADYNRFFNLCMSLEIGGKNRLVGIRLKGRRTLGAKRVNDIFPKSVEELVGSYFRGGKHGKCVYVPQIVRNVPIWYISGRTHI